MQSMDATNNLGPQRPLDQAVTELGWLPAVCGALDEQTRLATELQAHSDHQAELLAAEDFDGIALVLQERQPLVERLHEISQELEPFQRQMGSLWGSMNPDQQQDLMARVNRLQELLDTVRARDDEDRRALEAQRQLIGAELAGLDRGRTALGAYGGEAPDDAPRFQDREG